MRLAVFSTIAALSGLSLSQPGPTDIIDAITSLITQCEDLMGPASQLSVLNAPLMLLGGGLWVVRPRCPPFSPKTAADRQSIINGFVDLVTDLDQVAATPPPTAQFTGDDAMAVTNAFQGYGTAQRNVLDSVARVGFVVKIIPAVGPPVAGVLQNTAAAVKVSRGNPPPS